MYTTDTSRLKCVDFSCKQYIIWEYLDILTKKRKEKKKAAGILDIVKKSLWISSIFLVWFFRTKCPNAPRSKGVPGWWGEVEGKMT